MRQPINNINEKIDSTMILQNKLDEITHCQIVLDTILKKESLDIGISHNYNIFKQSLQVVQNRNLLQLIKDSAKALKINNSAQALLLLNLLSTYDPLNSLFSTCSDCLAVESLLINDYSIIKDFLSQTVQDKNWLTAKGNNDLRAVLGIQQFTAGNYNTAMTMLMSIHWEQLNINIARFVLQKFSILYWGGGAIIVERFICAFGQLSYNPILSNIDDTVTYGIFCAYTGQSSKAKKLLLPLLQMSISSPERFFQIVDGLWQADCDEDLKSFLCKSEVLASLEKILDRTQMLKLYAFLFNIGLIEASDNGFKLLAANPMQISLEELPSLVYGLTHTGNHAQADHLINTALTVRKEDQKSMKPGDAILLAESLILTGRVDKGRQILNTISTDRKPGDPLSPKLFMLHESVSQLDKIALLFPSIIDISQETEPKNLAYMFWFYFYSKKLEKGFNLVMEKFYNLKQCHAFPAHVAFLFWLGEFSDPLIYLEDKVFKGNGPISRQYIIWGNYLQLAEKSFSTVLDGYQKLLKLIDKNIMDTHNRINMFPTHFEYILLLRFLGYKEQAFQEAQNYSRRYPVFNNPCHVLLSILVREMKNSDPDVDEAHECERVADVLLNPRFLCQGWLYLHAAVIQAKLGRYKEATRILHDKLANTMFLHPEKRKLLLTASGNDIISLRNQIQSMFFPHFQDTYWNHLIDAVIFYK